MKSLKLIILATFFLYCRTAKADPILGPVECFKNAKTYSDLSNDEKSMADLCIGAVDDSPAKCYREARDYAGAAKLTAIKLCKPVICKTVAPNK